MTDYFYRAFEDKFRGARELIKTRLTVYRQFIAPLLSRYPDAYAIDIGCGRGEWLELLAQWGFSAKGIDSDEGMLASCHELGLNVEHGDAITCLLGLESESLAVVSAFHVVEHLPFDSLRTLVTEALRVLKPGGLLIMETPNPENVVVASRDFYLDPTHQRPIPTQLLSFVAEHAGFARVKTLRLQESDNLAGKAAVTLLDVFHGASPDYSVVAQKLAPIPELLVYDESFQKEFGLSQDDLLLRWDSYHESRIQQSESRVELLAHSQAQLQLLQEQERELRERLLQQEEAAHQKTQDMSRAVAEREGELEQELAALRAALEESRQGAIEREGRQRESFSLARDEMSRKAQAQIQVLQEQERELRERLLQQEEAAHQKTQDMSRAAAEREGELEQELAALRAALEESRQGAIEREGRQRESFSLARDEINRKAEAQIQFLQEKELVLRERLLQQQQDSHRASEVAAQARLEREVALQNMASERLSQQQQETQRFRTECETLTMQLALEKLRLQQATSVQAATCAQVGELLAELDRVCQCWIWRLTAPFRLFHRCGPTYSILSATMLNRLLPEDISMPPDNATTSRGVLCFGETPGCSTANFDQAMTHSQTEHTHQQRGVNFVPTVIPQSLDELLTLPAAVFIDHAYRILLSRAPDPEGKAYYQTRLRDGYGRASVLAQLYRSPECTQSLAKVMTKDNDEGFVEMLYRRYLGRPGDQGGLHYYQKLLKNGTERKDVADEIRTSREARARNTIWTQLDALIDIEEKSRRWYWFGLRAGGKRNIFQHQEVLIEILANISNAQLQTSRRLEWIEECLIKMDGAREKSGHCDVNEGGAPTTEGVTISNPVEDTFVETRYSTGMGKDYVVNAHQRSPLEAYLQRKGAE